MIPRPSYTQIVLAALFVIVIAFAVGFLDRARRAEDRVRDAEAQADFNAGATRQLDTYVTTTTAARKRGQEAELVVQNAPGASAPLDPDNRRTVCAELERVRGSAVCTD